MVDSESGKSSPGDAQKPPVAQEPVWMDVMGEDTLVLPSWKPLMWFGGGLVLLIALWEVFLDLGLDLLELLYEVLEKVWLVLIEAPEEFLEDRLADWLKNHFPHEAERYSEITTAIGLTPLKALLIFMFLRWLWRESRRHHWPRLQRWVLVRVFQVKLAWRFLPWPYRILAALALVGVLVVLI